MRQGLDPSVSLSGLFESPETYKGKRVMLGGVITETRNLPQRTEIEVVQKNLDSYGYVESGDKTIGRFIFSQPGYLESEVYSKGRTIVGAGKVLGGKKGKIGERDYLFPLIEAEEIHLWENYKDYYYYDPYYLYYPFSPYYYPYGFRAFGHHY